MMHKTFTLIRRLIASFRVTEASPDPLSRMSSRELADLPVHHPRTEPCPNG